MDCLEGYAEIAVLDNLLVELRGKVGDGYVRAEAAVAGEDFERREGLDGYGVSDGAAMAISVESLSFVFGVLSSGTG